MSRALFTGKRVRIVDLQLVGRRALVTGGSRGIGRAVATALVAEGATVTIAARGHDALEQTAAELGVHMVVADTGDDASVRGLVAEATETMGGVDILVNAAAKPGGQSRPPALAEITSDAFWADVNTKVLGYLRCAQAVAPGMVDRGWGRIISVSGLAARSTGSTIGSIRNVAVAAMTKNLADELGPSGVNVTVVQPGVTRTEATPATVGVLATADGVAVAEIEQRYARATTIGRMVEAAEVATVITFLTSPLSVAVNGDAIACGRLARQHPLLRSGASEKGSTSGWLIASRRGRVCCAAPRFSRVIPRFRICSAVTLCSSAARGVRGAAAAGVAARAGGDRVVG